LDKKFISTYVFVHEKRAELTKMLQKISPDPSKYLVFLLSTGSEATENCIKLAKTYAMEKHGPQKKYLVSFNYAFHGRTLGSQLAGGMAKQNLIGEVERSIQVPFPDGYKNEGIPVRSVSDSERERLNQMILPNNDRTYQGVDRFPG
jgi:adenosylmethionine-8-amino-7-oxononanoate aminotransferase